MIEICKCGYPKCKHLDLSEFIGLKQTRLVVDIIEALIQVHIKRTGCFCISFEVDNLRSLESELERRENYGNCYQEL